MEHDLEEPEDFDPDTAEDDEFNAEFGTEYDGADGRTARLEREERRLGYKVVQLTPKASATVNVGKGDQGRIFTEVDSRHPGGQVVVVRGRRVKVYPTKRVLAAIGEGILEETRRPETAAPVQVSDVLDQARREQLAAAARQGVTPQAVTAAPPADPDVTQSAVTSGGSVKSGGKPAGKSQASRR